MANSTSSPYNNLFSSLVSDIKSYTGKDPLLPWIRGIRKMRETLPPQLLGEKLPRFLQKCVQAFDTDRRYTNDLRYLRVWLQLLDFVDDPGAVLRTMKANLIGLRRSLFYQAYALYFEKMKKYEEAEKMYHLGVRNLAEPIEDLQKSFEHFIHRMERHNKKRIQLHGRRATNRPTCSGSISLNCDEDKESDENKSRPTESSFKKSLLETQPKFGRLENKMPFALEPGSGVPGKESNHTGIASNLNNVKTSSDPSVNQGVKGDFGCKSYVKHKHCSEAEPDEPKKCFIDDTVVVDFVDTAIVGKSEAEDARHHGLVEPSINTKEVMNAINSMFREPLEPARVGRRLHSRKQKSDQNMNNEFKVFVDENLDKGVGSSNLLEKDSFLPLHKGTETHQYLQEPLEIYIDDDEENSGIIVRSHENSQHGDVEQMTEGAPISGGNVSAFVFPKLKDLSPEGSEDLNVARRTQERLREDTVVYRFVGSTISDEPQVENVCHHGLVEPTINLKEAMDDINSMFGKPIEFARKNRTKKQDKAPDKNRDCGGFLILPDDDSDNKQGKFRPSSSSRKESDLFEQTVCTKEAMEEINKMFGMPLDF